MATAPGYEPATLEVRIGPSGDAQTLTIPELQATSNAEAPVAPSPAPAPATPSVDPTPPAPPPPPVAPLPVARAEAPDSLGWVVGGTGIALAGLGTAFYVLSLSADAQATSQCRYEDRYGCSDAALDAEARRDTYATLATISGGVGLVGIGAGAWLLLTGPSNETPARARASVPRLVPSLAPHAGSLVLKGAFP